MNIPTPVSNFLDTFSCKKPSETIFLHRDSMKYSELHRKIIQAGWKFDHAAGSHYYYTKEGKIIGPVPYHGSKEIPKGLQRSIERVFKLCEK